MENPFNHHLRVSRQQILGLFLAAILAGGIAGSARAQVTASVSGRVEDSSGPLFPAQP